MAGPIWAHVTIGHAKSMCFGKHSIPEPQSLVLTVAGMASTCVIVAFGDPPEHAGGHFELNGRGSECDQRMGVQLSKLEQELLAF
jgi:hypothetical protein